MISPLSMSCDDYYVDAIAVGTIVIHDIHGFHILGEKPHLCSQCGNSFKLYKTYRAHLTTHLDVKPHQCPGCDKSFGQSYPLKRHKKKHNHYENTRDGCSNGMYKWR